MVKIAFSQKAFFSADERNKILIDQKLDKSLWGQWRSDKSVDGAIKEY